MRMTKAHPSSSIQVSSSLKKHTSVMIAYTMARYPTMLIREVLSTWKAMHIDMRARLSQKQPTSMIHAYLLDSSPRRLLLQNAITESTNPRMIIPCTAWWIISSAKWTRFSLRLITPTPEKSHAWHRQKQIPSHILLSGRASISAFSVKA